MKNLFAFIFFLLCFAAGYAQGVSVNENGIPADPNAMLDVSSHTKGVLIPRLRTSERLSIVGPTEGLLVYDIDAHGFWFAQGGVGRN